MKTCKRLHVVNDGVLSLLPLSILPVHGNKDFFKDTHISYLPALSLLKLVKKKQNSSETMLALGDPVYTKEAELDYQQKKFMVATRGSHFLKAFTALPETRSEVNSIIEKNETGFQRTIGCGGKRKHHKNNGFNVL
ncbi:MAG: CHAT domain-containing protein [Lentisphaeraceae bacterium]|nr:CHAT domain-containing protein [Lentisphaeraceae bacterium]